MEKVKTNCISLGIPYDVATTTTGKGADTKEVEFYFPCLAKLEATVEGIELAHTYVGKTIEAENVADICSEVLDLLERRIRLDLMNSARGGLREPAKSKNKANSALADLFSAVAGEDASFLARAREIAAKQGVDLDALMSVSGKAA